MNIEQKDIDRFWSKVDKSGICWEWLASRDIPPRLDYGRFKLKGKTRKAHRVCWIIVNGKIPQGMCVCHICDNPSCVNPEHLFLGTHQDNNDDMVRKNRELYPVGEDAFPSKLTEKQVLRIRKLYATGCVSQSNLGRMYGVNQSAIWKIVNRKRWRHI